MTTNELSVDAPDKSVIVASTLLAIGTGPLLNHVVLKLEHQARKHKEKLTSRKKRAGKRIEAAAEPSGPTARNAPRILPSDRYRLKPLSADDAVMELDSAGGDLLVYRDDQTYRVNVVYRRKDGNFGLVDPEF